MRKYRLFLVNNVYMLTVEGNVTKQLCVHICMEYVFYTNSSFMWDRATALHASRAEVTTSTGPVVLL